MRVKTWKILDRGDVPIDAPTVPWECRCGRVADLPIHGRVLVITGDEGDEGIVFDSPDYAMPVTIQCRKCGRVTTTAE